ncbi:queuosine precursor transporter [uncultured Mycolicibacterium sp.]|uniref:queuosine precursor transporter n=1 Tax=uncultured Mycolicibacterium sp. TaxID=2320817 RepID=UPI00260B8C8D|nr:queuosine precursor transporter [uncultured Mycolicibacterium sp.]
MTGDEQTPHRGHALTGSPYYPVLVAVFTGLVLISNVAATKGVAFGPIITDGGFVVFPLTYVIGDVLSEVYGFRAARRAIVVAFVMEALAAVAFWVTAVLPPAEFYQHQAAFESVVKPFVQLVVAGLAGFLVGQTLNAWAVVRIKAITKERHLWARLLGSTVLGEFADTLVFCSIAAPAIGITTLDDFLVYLVLGFVYKTAVEVVVLPVTYRVIAFVKRREPSYSPAV